MTIPDSSTLAFAPLGLRCLAVSRPGMHKKQNEDALLLDREVHQGTVRQERLILPHPGRPLVFAVADGMAGSPSAQAGSRALLLALEESFARSPLAPASLRSRLEVLQHAFVEQARLMKCRGAAATLAGVAIAGDQATVFNVGDSRVYALRRGTIRQLSRDHTELADMIDSGEIAPISVREAPVSFLEPSSFFMADPMHTMSQVHVQSITWAEGDVLLICSDGLSDALEDQDIACADLGSIEGLESLVASVRRKDGTDDVTILVIARQTPVAEAA